MIDHELPVGQAAIALHANGQFMEFEHREALADLVQALIARAGAEATPLAQAA